MSKFLTIFGSRKTPPDVIETLEKIADFFSKKGYVLRSGGADGADSVVTRANGKKEIYLPWKGFNGVYDGILWSQANWDAAHNYHPVWDSLSANVKCLHARNVSLCLGLDNQTPSELAVCWTPNGEEIGGSATAIRICKDRKIKLFNLGAKTGLTKLRKFCKKL